MFVRVKLIARRIRTAESFEALDPWNEGRPASFRLEVYKMFPEHVTDPRDFRDGTMYTWGAKALYGIRSEIDGVERMLPTFLGDAWTAGKVPSSWLPELLFRSAPGLKAADFRPVSGTVARRAALAGAVVALAGGIGLALAGGNVPKVQVAIVTTDAWLAAPATVGQSWAVNGMVPLAGKEPTPPGFVVPEEVAKIAGPAFHLAWTRTPSGHRALLLPDRGYERGGAAELGWSVALAPEEVGLAEALRRIRARVPDLDTSTVTASRWTAGSRRSAAETGRIASILVLFAGLATAIGAGAAWLAHAPQRSRNRMLSARLPGGPTVAPR